MSAEIHKLPHEGADDVEDLPLAPSGSVYLDAYLAPFQHWLERDTVTEIIVNRPGEVWIEDAGRDGMQRIKSPEIDDKLVQRLAEQVARVSPMPVCITISDSCSSAPRRELAWMVEKLPG